MKIISTSFALVYATSTASANNSVCSNLSYAYPHVSPVEYQDQGQNYEMTFFPTKYNTECVDSTGEQFEYGTIEGVNPSIDTPGGGCSNFCIKGYGRAEARGCYQRPPVSELVGFEYDCEQATCKCLYQVGTLGDQYSECFDDMNASNQGNVFSNQDKLENVYTLPKQGQTCYARLFNAPSPSPAPVGSGICTYTPDYDCYKSGHPSCCDENNGKDCPNELTMCDNTSEGMTGWNYCASSPDYKCYEDGQPNCCAENAMNCPKTKPGCDRAGEAAQFVKYLRSNR
eukprot:scaffold33169_cov166-Skeletonema_menzelii.AAC.1